MWWCNQQHARRSVLHVSFFAANLGGEWNAKSTRQVISDEIANNERDYAEFLAVDIDGILDLYQMREGRYVFTRIPLEPRRGGNLAFKVSCMTNVLTQSWSQLMVERFGKQPGG